MTDKLIIQNVANAIQKARDECGGHDICFGYAEAAMRSALATELSRLSEENERLKALLTEPSKEMVDAGIAALDDCKDSSWDSGPDGESYNSYEYVRSDAAAVTFRAMAKIALSTLSGGQQGLPR